MKRIAFTGLNGVVGRLMLETPSSLVTNNQIIDLYHSKPVSNIDVISEHLDLLDLTKILPALEMLNPDVVIHLAAITHIDRCESDRHLGREGKVWQLNVEATKKITDFCEQHHKQLIYFSTECVFNGKKKKYTERETQSPKNWYGTTKAEAEKYIVSHLPSAAIIRGVVAYHPSDSEGGTIFGRINNHLKNNTEIRSVADQSLTPTFIGDFLITIEKILEKQASGIFHATPSEVTSPYEFGQQVAEFLDYNKKLIKRTTLVEYFNKEQALLRLKNAALDSTKTQQVLGIKYKTLQQALTEHRQ